MLERRKAPLRTDAQRKTRLLFARQHRHWKFEDWCNVLFSDESPYQVFYVPYSPNDTVWGSQEENVPVASQVKFSPTVLVWGGRACDSHRINATTFCTSAYIN